MIYVRLTLRLSEIYDVRISMTRPTSGSSHIPCKKYASPLGSYRRNEQFTCCELEASLSSYDIRHLTEIVPR